MPVDLSIILTITASSSTTTTIALHVVLMAPLFIVTVALKLFISGALIRLWKAWMRAIADGFALNVQFVK